MFAWLNGLYEDEQQSPETFATKHLRLAVVLASALALYLEMVMIRWQATCAHVFAIFKNVSLLSCFLGLGIGFALAARRRRVGLMYVLPLLAAQVAFFSLISTTVGGRRTNPIAEQVVMGQFEDWSWLSALEGNTLLAVTFLVNAMMFIPLGNLAGWLMNRLPAVQGYSLNLLGSLAGIAAFFVMSLAWAPPAVWLGGVFLAMAPFLAGHPRMSTVGLTSVVAVLISVGLMGRLEERRFYSPYQTITLRLPQSSRGATSPTIKVNHAFYQDITNYSPAAMAAAPELKEAAAYYNLPFRVRPNPGDVLVVGAGAGNDVAAALRHEARSVTAVEIDPAILYIGKRLHPERPYFDPRTSVEINDARSYLRQTDKRFDTIIYGLLDSHTNLGAMTNVRLDSFVYTVEGFREAVARLKDDGLLIVSYLLIDETQGNKLYAMLTQAYPEKPPRVFRTPRGLTVVTGPGLPQVPAAVAETEERTAQYAAGIGGVDLPTDDWPYFYMQKRTYPVTYAGMILLMLALSAWLVRRELGTMRVAGSRGGVFFFLGAGFMLIETKAITELGLIFGNTWMVSAIAVTGILVMGYLANRWVMRRGPMPQVPAFVMLAAVLGLGLLVTRLSMTGVVLPAAKLLMPVVLTLPLFFAGLIFSGELTKGGEIGDAISANLFGAMLGGFLEYNSMYFGLSSLYPLGMVLYAAALGCSLLSGQRAQTADETLSLNKAA